LSRVLALIFVAQAPVAGEDASKCSVIFPRLSAEQRATQIFPLPLCDSVFCAGASDLWLVLLKAPVKSVCAAMVFHFRVLAVLELVSSLGRTPARDFYGFIFPVQISVSFVSPKAARFS
jgi:hypothetical protein